MLAKTFFTDLEIKTRESHELLESLPVIERCMRGEVEMRTYIAFLTEAYHHVKHTVPLLMACGSRLAERLEWLREAIIEYTEEEVGHQEWILNDLATLGVDSEKVRYGQPTLPTELMVSYAYDLVMRNNPVGFFGMVYVLEKTSSTIATHVASQIASTLSLTPQSMTYLVSHGSLDIKHMKTFEQLMNRLDCDEDKQSVLHSARIFYELYANIFRSLPITQLSTEGVQYEN